MVEFFKIHIFSITIVIENSPEMLMSIIYPCISNSAVKECSIKVFGKSGMDKCRGERVTGRVINNIVSEGRGGR